MLDLEVPVQFSKPSVASELVQTNRIAACAQDLHTLSLKTKHDLHAHYIFGSALTIFGSALTITVLAFVQLAGNSCMTQICTKETCND